MPVTQRCRVQPPTVRRTAPRPRPASVLLLTSRNSIPGELKKKDQVSNDSISRHFLPQAQATGQAARTLPSSQCLARGPLLLLSPTPQSHQGRQARPRPSYL